VGAVSGRGADLGAMLPAAVDAWIAFECGRSLEDALGQARSARRLEGPAVSALRDIVSTAVRRRAAAAWIRGELVQRPAEPRAAALLAVAIALALAGTYGEHVLVDQAVGVARREGGAPAGGFVNGVLRSFLRRRSQLEAAAHADPARRYNVPAWWYAKVCRELGALAAPALEAQLREPALVLRVNVRRASVAGTLAALAGAGMAAHSLGGEAILLERPVPVERIPGFARGEVSVQDAGAQLAARWLEAGDGMRVLDACAAPGAKTAHLLERSQCLVDAVESDPARAARIAPGLERLGLLGDGAGAGARATIHTADVCDPSSWWSGRPYDRIVLDAPCTGSGVVSRHPDIAWLRRPSDVAKSATLQAKMLDTLWPLLAPTGRFLYVVCSVFAEEGARQIDSFLRREPKARPVGLAGSGHPQVLLVPGGSAQDPAGGAPGGLELPRLHDGFFFALLEKN
jgi:16S rRNA (cytosine967-C5)-methyltransferase